MIPVLIVLGSAAASAAGLFVGAAATAAAHEVVQESKDELNAINADMQKMTEDANSAIASCKETYSVSMEKFDDARTNAYLSVLPEFTQVMSNIKHTEMGGDITLTQKLSEVDNAVVSCQSNFEYYNFLLDERRLRQTKVTDLDRKLWEKVIQFSDFFEDMLFTPGTITYPFLECKISDDNGNEIAPTAVLPVGLHNFNYNSFYYRVREMTPPYMACFNKANYSLKVDPRHIDDDYVILHEMIHMHEFVLEIYPTYYHDAILYSLYHDLRSKIEDLDRRMERQGHIVMQEELAQFGGVHDLLFLLKSFDLDLRMNYPLGTVFGYGMAD